MTTPAPSSITTWTRLEPRARGDSLAPALQARVYDPAWMLAMQRLLAEFRGQDAAFPVQVSYSVDTWPLAGYQPGAGSAPYPLEAFAWPEPAAPMTPGASAESGAELLRLLNEQGCSPATAANIIAAYPLAAPGPARRALAGDGRPAGDRVPDAGRGQAAGYRPARAGPASGDHVRKLPGQPRPGEPGRHRGDERGDRVAGRPRLVRAVHAVRGRPVAAEPTGAPVLCHRRVRRRDAGQPRRQRLAGAADRMV